MNTLPFFPERILTGAGQEYLIRAAASAFNFR
jgi:hypothetical protein